MLSVLFKEGWYLYVAFTNVAAVTIIILYGSITENCCGGREVVVLNRYSQLYVFYGADPDESFAPCVRGLVFLVVRMNGTLAHI